MPDKLDRSDYTDPQCPFCTDQYEKTQPVRRIPTSRVIEKLDEHLGRNDPDAARLHLLYWLEEARLGGDGDGELTVLNELMGLARNTGDRDGAYKYAGEAVSLAERVGLADHVTGATTYLNHATVCKAFDEPEKALSLYEKARAIYEKELPPTDYRLGGLYNNMGLALEALGRFDEAEAVYEKALELMLSLEDCKAEAAITCLNLADLVRDRDGFEAGEAQINELLDRAEALLDDPANKRDGSYAFMCDKCAAVLGYYGRFAAEAELRERAREIYERD